MKSLIVLLALSLSSCLYANSITHIECNQEGYKLKIEVDVFETLPPQSLIKLFKNGYFIGEQRALKKVIYQEPIEGDLLQKIFHFEFLKNKIDIFKFLRVYLSQKIAYLTYIDIKNAEISIQFEDCNFKFGQPGT